MIAWIGGLCVVLASLMLYAAAPHQQLRPGPFGKGMTRFLKGGGMLGLVLGLLLLLQWAGPATAAFIALVLAMLVWSVVPLGIAWVRSASKENQ